MLAGHYTQIVNDGTVAVGCGATKCGNSYYAYCNYAVGQYGISQPFVSGKPCTNCSKCSNNLCSCNKLCANYGKLNKQTCTCTCQPYATGNTCETLICDKSDAGKMYLLRLKYCFTLKNFLTISLWMLGSR